MKFYVSENLNKAANRESRTTHIVLPSDYFQKVTWFNAYVTYNYNKVL